ncbi:MAG TPA: hypothetical protein VK166_04095 [Chitinophagaceae bacterium]|nr:hypothetical protein [Chitinophagaceae bacterium]
MPTPTLTSILRQMDYFLFFLYIILFLFLVRYLDKKNIIRINIGLASAAFVLKVSMACLYGYIFQKYYGGDDTWMYHYQSLEETAFLKSDPLHFLHSLINPTAYTRYMMTTWWQELEYASLIKLLAVLNVFSGGSYYVNAVLFSMLTFWGAYFYYRLLVSVFPKGRTIFLLVFFFFIPLIFWTSGIRKDGLILLSTGMFFYSFYLFLGNKSRKLLLVSLFALLGVALNRNFVALSMVPLALAWAISSAGGVKPWKAFIFVYALSLVLVFISPLIGPVNIPAAFVQRQSDFLALQGGSYVELDRLEANPVSFIKLLPQALNHVFLRPYPGENNGALYVFSALETWFVMLVFLLFLLFPLPHTKRPLFHACFWALIFFALTNYLFIGYTIPFLGAIVRYRIIYESILLAVVAVHVNWEKLLPKRIYNKFI